MIFRIILLVWLIIPGLNVQAQSKKLIRTYGIKSMTERTVKFEKGVEQLAFISYTENFDKRGNWLERTAFNKEGTIKTIEKRSYNRGLLVSETKEEAPQKSKDEKPASYRHRTYEYSKDMLIAEKHWDSQGQLILSKEYGYNKFGQKISEVEWNTEGEKKKSEVYSYNKKGFRTSKVTYNANGEITEKLVYAYE